MATAAYSKFLFKEILHMRAMHKIILHVVDEIKSSDSLQRSSHEIFKNNSQQSAVNRFGGSHFCSTVTYDSYRIAEKLLRI